MATRSPENIDIMMMIMIMIIILMLLILRRKCCAKQACQPLTNADPSVVHKNGLSSPVCMHYPPFLGGGVKLFYSSLPSYTFGGLKSRGISPVLAACSVLDALILGFQQMN